MSNKKPIRKLFDENTQRIFFSVILIACLLIIIGILNLNLEFQAQNQNNNTDSQDVSFSLPANDAIYSLFGQISDLGDNTIKLQVTLLGNIEQYTITVNEETTYTNDVTGETTAISLADLRIGDSVSAISDQNIKNESSWLAQRIQLNSR